VLCILLAGLTFPSCLLLNLESEIGCLLLPVSEKSFRGLVVGLCCLGNILTGSVRILTGADSILTGSDISLSDLSTSSFFLYFFSAIRNASSNGSNGGGALGE